MNYPKKTFCHYQLFSNLCNKIKENKLNLEKDNLIEQDVFNYLEVLFYPPSKKLKNIIDYYKEYYAYNNSFDIIKQNQVVNENDRKLFKSIVVPDNIKTIDNDAFWGYTELNNLVLPENLLFIKRFAFADCYKLKNFKFPDNVCKIEIGAFFNCHKLTEVNLPKKLALLEDAAFGNCKNLEKVTFHKNTQCVGNNIFKGCKKLREIYIPKENHNVFNFLKLPSKKTKIIEY